MKEFPPPQVVKVTNKLRSDGRTHILNATASVKRADFPLHTHKVSDSSSCSQGLNVNFGGHYPLSTSLTFTKINSVVMVEAQTVP